jgi:hypothetical protein
VSSAISPNVAIELRYMSSPSHGEGWNAEATHAAMSDASRDECGVFVGDVSYSPNAAVTRPALVTCY